MKHAFYLRTFASRIFLILCGCVFVLSGYAQSIVVTGTVTDVNGEPMIGVSVVPEKEPGSGTITDLNGKFTVHVEKGTLLKFSYIGYVEEKIRVTTNSVKVVLREDSKQLDEVVVVGYGVQKK